MKTKKYFSVVFSLFFTLIGFAQAGKKLDRIIKKDYQVIECTISKMSDTTIEYSLPGESLKIDLDVSKVARIDFASGRSQTFDAAQNTVDSSSNTSTNTSPIAGSIVAAEMKTNTIAVLPVPYINTDNLQSSDEMSKFAQNDLYNKLIDKSSNIFPLTVQDLRTTNSLLHNAGINHTNIDETPIDQLEKILGVDNIVAAKVSFNTTTNTTTTGYNHGEVKYDNNRVKSNDYNVGNANTQTQYHFTVYFDMYKNTTKIYSQTRKPVFYFKDSWMDSVSYLLKRSPIYVKK